jgi:hypothetical protein
MPKLGAKALANHPETIKNDFIPHPAQFPLRFRRHGVLPWAPRSTEPPAGDVGLSFHSTKYIPAGTRLDLEIPLRGQVQRFTVTVVLVRERPQGFEIGLWFNSSSDAERARLVEKICHTECSLMARPNTSP